MRSLADATPGAGGTPSTGSKAESNLETEQKEKKEESKSMGWGMFFAYFACGAGTVSFLYYFYKAKYSFHQTEILIVDAFRRLPLYWPPTPRDGEMNSRTDAKGLPEDIKLAFCEWFVVTDLEEPKGVSRDDVLELISELGYSEKAQPAKDFLYRGEGHIEEKRRLTCTSLQESLTLLCALRADAETKLAKPQEPKEGEDPMPQPKSDAEALEILKRKFRRAASVLNSAEQLRAWQATAGAPVVPVPSVPSPVSSPQASHTPTPAAPLEEPKDIEESEDRRLEELRLARLEEELLGRLERLGSLSLAEESRLNDIRHQRSALKVS